MLVERSFDFRNIIYFSYEISLKYGHKQIERTFLKPLHLIGVNDTNRILRKKKFDRYRSCV
jgi:hypothetical protein